MPAYLRTPHHFRRNMPEQTTSRLVQNKTSPKHRIPAQLQAARQISFLNVTKKQEVGGATKAQIVTFTHITIQIQVHGGDQDQEVHHHPHTHHDPGSRRQPRPTSSSSPSHTTQSRVPRYRYTETTKTNRRLSAHNCNTRGMSQTSDALSNITDPSRPSSLSQTLIMANNDVLMFSATKTTPPPSASQAYKTPKNNTKRTIDLTPSLTY